MARELSERPELSLRRAVLAVVRRSVMWRLSPRLERLPLPAQRRRRARRETVMELRRLRDEFHAVHRSGLWDETHDAARRLVEFREQAAEAHGFDPRARRYLGREFAQHFGTLALLDVLAKEAALEGGGPETIVIADPALISNRPYLHCFRPHFASLVDDAVEIEARAWEASLLALFPHTWRARDGCLLHHIEAGIEVEESWRAEQRAPLVRIPDREVERGHEMLAALGLPQEAWFAVLHVREESRYESGRNADVAAFEPAIDAVVEAGGWVIRIGDPSGTPLRARHGVVDYARSAARSPATDVFLLSQARLMIGTDSGPAAVAGTFGVPVVGTNWLLPLRSWMPASIFLPKLLRRDATGELLRLEDALASPASFLQEPEKLARLGVTAVDNTADEIEAAVLELLDVLEHGVRYSAADDELQLRYHLSQPPLRHPLPRPAGRVSREFLRRHEDLLS